MYRLLKMFSTPKTKIAKFEKFVTWGSGFPKFKKNEILLN